MLQKHYKALPYKHLTNQTSLYRPRSQLSNSLTMDDPAIEAMTDLQKVPAYTINALATIGEANEKMISCGVRLLFVTDPEGRLFGLITATDISGGKPLTYLNGHGGNRDSILVQDIMTNRDDLEAVTLEAVEHACVGDVVESLRHCKRQHMLVFETYSDESRQLIRGIFSSTQIEKQLGMKLNRSGQANTFVELEKAIVTTA